MTGFSRCLTSLFLKVNHLENRIMTVFFDKKKVTHIQVSDKTVKVFSSKALIFETSFDTTTQCIVWVNNNFPKLKAQVEICKSK